MGPVKICPLLCFQNSKVWISDLDLKGWLLPLANVTQEINGLMPLAYDILSKNQRNGKKFVKLNKFVLKYAMAIPACHTSH